METITETNKISFSAKVNKFFSNRVVIIILQVLAFALFAVYLAQLFIHYDIDGNVSYYWKGETKAGEIKTLQAWSVLWVQYEHMSPALAKTLFVFMVFLRWSTIVFLGFAVIVPFFGGKTCKAILAFVGPIVGALNLIFLTYNFRAWDFFYLTDKSNGIYTEWRATLFIIEQILLLTISVSYLVRYILGHDFKGISLKRLPFIIFGMYVTFFYQPILTILFRQFGDITVDFTPIHIVSISMNAVFLIVAYFAMRHKTIEDKRIFFAALACSGVFNFFYYQYASLNNLPLHLCNAAIVLMFIAFIFKAEGIFYFTYFVNVIGALFAMMMPDWHPDAFSLSSVRFWYNHIYAFVVPILGVALHVYPRPKLQQMGKAIIWFTVYYVIVAFCNPWFSNYPGQGNINYFFINEPFYLEKIGMDNAGNKLYEFLWNQNVVKFDIPDIFHKVETIHITLRPAYFLLVYVVFVGLMFVMWYIYDAMFKTADNHYALLIKKKLIRQGYTDFKKELNGKSPKLPLYEEMKDMIQIEHFTKIYSGSDKKAVDDLTLTVPGGTVYGFLGHNGAGKSTTIKSIVGIQTITSGRIIVEGYDVAKQSVEAKLQIGYVSDNHAVYERLTGREYINYIADLYMVPQAERDERIEKYTKMFKLEDAIDQEAKSYSHGMKQKLVVIASLIHDPKVWILDEPLTGLDPTSSFQIKECMREHANRGNIVFFSSHVIEVVEKICDHICIINHGKLVCQYSMKEIHDQGISLEELYMKYLHVEDERA